MNRTQHSATYDSQNVAAEEKIYSSARQAMLGITPNITSQLRSLGAERISLTLSEMPKNTMDSSLKISVEAFTKTGPIGYSLVLPFQSGMAVYSEALIKSSYEDAVTAAKAAPAVTAMKSVDTMKVDLTKVKASKVGDLVLYMSEELPTWSFHASVDSLTDSKNRPIIASRIVASIRGNVLADFSRVAEFMQKEFALPIVRESNVTAKLEAAKLPSTVVPMTTVQIEAEIYDRNMTLSGLRPIEALASDNHASDKRGEFEATLRRTVEPVIIAHVMKAGGSLPQFLGMDFSKAKQKTWGQTFGEVTASVRYFTNNSIEETTFVVPFSKETGAIDASKISKDALTIQAEDARAKELKILSEDEAKRQLDAYRKVEAAATESLISGLGITAAGTQGSNLWTSPAAARIPVLKAIMPSETKEGDKVELKGYVYQVCATDYNCASGDTEHSAFFMLALTDELPNGKRPMMSYWS